MTRGRAAVLLLMAALAAWWWVDVRRRGRVDPARPEVHRTDFTVYTAAGGALLRGEDPYRATNPRGWHYLYPPLFALLVAPLSAWGGEAQVTAWFLISLAFAWGIFRELRRLLPPDPRWRALIGGGALAAALLPGLDCLQRGQVGLALLYPTLLGTRLVLEGGRRRNAVLGGLLLAIPACIKVLPAFPAIAALLIAPKDRRLGAILGLLLGSALALGLIPGLALGWSRNLALFDEWMDRIVLNPDVGGVQKFDEESVRNQSLARGWALLRRELGIGRPRIEDNVMLAGASTLGEGTLIAIQHAIIRPQDAFPAPPTESLAFARALIAALVLLAAWGSSRLGGSARAGGAGLAIAAPLAISPLAWGHYYVAWAPAVVGVAAALYASGRQRLAAALAIAPGALAVAYYAGLVWEPLAWVGKSGLLGLGAAAWITASAGALLLLLVADRRSPGSGR